MEVVDFGGWPHCIRLSNGEVELVVTTDVGPRVIRFGFVGGQNMFHNYPESLGKTGGDAWVNYGGHRLWHGPEHPVRTYAPDNSACEHSWDGKSLTVRNVEPANLVAKEIRVTLAPDAARVDLVHRVYNNNPWAIELAPWAVSVMEQNGRAIFPQEDFREHGDDLLPARRISIWPYADMSDPRFTWGHKYIQVRQDPTHSSTKIGLLNTKGWAAYVLGGDVFLKRYPFKDGAPYIDLGVNTECYTDPNILEIETLGPLTKIEPGGYVEHLESWVLAHADCGTAEADIDAKILPLVARLPQL
jgi:hypothetical protein